MARKGLTVGAGVLATLAMFVFGSPMAAQADTSGKYNGQIPQGGVLYGGQYIESGEDGYLFWKLIMQKDGNLVIYSVLDGSVCWASNTQYHGYKAVYQTDGNFVVYDSSGKPTWASHTQHKGGTTTNLNTYGGLYVGTTRVTSNCE